MGAFKAMINELKRKLEIGSSSERESAVRELENLGTPEAVELLRLAAKDDNLYVRQTAAVALRNLGCFKEELKPKIEPKTQRQTIMTKDQTMQLLQELEALATKIRVHGRKESQGKSMAEREALAKASMGALLAGAQVIGAKYGVSQSEVTSYLAIAVEMDKQKEAAGIEEEPETTSPSVTSGSPGKSGCMLILIVLFVLIATGVCIAAVLAR